MKRTTVFAMALALIALVAFTIPTFAQGPTGGNPWGGFGMMGGYGRGGMMGGFAPGQAITPTTPYGWGGMMGGYGYAPNATPVTLDQAVTRAQQYVAAYNNSDLQLDEVEEYAWNFYVVVKEKNTGTGAFQLIVDKSSGAVYPEMGPNMMWNTKYSPMVFMMGGWFAQAPSKMTVSAEQARANAEQYLKSYLPNATLDKSVDAFYGYYNLDVLQNDKTFGMLSVNGYTGEVWYHTWHGAFVQSKEIE